VSRYILEQTPLKLIVYDPRSNRLETVTDLSILDRIKVSTHVGYNVFGTASAFWLARIDALNAKAGAACNERLNDVRPPPRTEGIAARELHVLGREPRLGQGADRKVSAGTPGVRGDRDPVARAGAARGMGFGAAIRAVATSGNALHPRAGSGDLLHDVSAQPVGKKAHVQVCGTTPCRLRGAEDIIKVCQSRIHHDPFHLSKDGNFSWEEVECLGACVNAPMVLIWKDTYEDLTKENFGKVLDGFASGNPPKPGPQIDRQFSAPVGGPTTLKETT
jgi:NADH-quinone oxidoreductase subunit E